MVFHLVDLGWVLLYSILILSAEIPSLTNKKKIWMWLFELKSLSNFMEICIKNKSRLNSESKVYQCIHFHFEYIEMNSFRLFMFCKCKLFTLSHVLDMKSRVIPRSCPLQPNLHHPLFIKYHVIFLWNYSALSTSVNLINLASNLFSQYLWGWN